MEFLTQTKAVKLKSRSNKYLIVEDDQISTRLSRDGAVRKARWLVELVDTNPHVVRLKSCYNSYLTASDVPFFLGMRGRKVLQTMPGNRSKDLTIEWQPIWDGFRMKLKAFDGSYLRANGRRPPWRNSVTHDNLHAASIAPDWVVWYVEAVEVPEDEAVADYWSMVWSSSPIADQISGLEIGPESPVSVRSSFFGSASPSSPRWLSTKKMEIGLHRQVWRKKNEELLAESKWVLQISCIKGRQSRPSLIARTPAIDLFQNVKAVRLRSVHGKYLIAGEDKESVTQDRNGSSPSAKWAVELVENSDTIIRLRSCYGKYLTASNQPFLLRTTGSKVLQTLPDRLDSSVEWEPIRENGAVKMKTRYGHFLRANGGLPPWKNSVTHDIPHRTATRNWILWEVIAVEMLPALLPPPPQPEVVKEESFVSGSSSPTASESSESASFSRQESNVSFDGSPRQASEGRLVYFYIANEDGEIDEDCEEQCITFKGSEVNELEKMLEIELGIAGLSVCSRSPWNGKHYPLRLQLPPNNATMHVVVVPPPSTGIGQPRAAEWTKGSRRVRWGQIRRTSNWPDLLPRRRRTSIDLDEET